MLSDALQDAKISLFSAFSSSILLQDAHTQVVSLRVLLEMQQLVTVMRGGDIIVVPLEEGVVRLFFVRAHTPLNSI